MIASVAWRRLLPVPCRNSPLAHDPEKWVPVFGWNHAHNCWLCRMNPERDPLGSHPVFSPSSN